MNEEMRLEVYSERVLQHDVNALFYDNNTLTGQGVLCNPGDQEFVIRQGRRVAIIDPS